MFSGVVVQNVEPIANAQIMFGLSDSITFGSVTPKNQDAAATVWAGITPDTACATLRNRSHRDTNGETRQAQDGSALAADVADSSPNSVPSSETSKNSAPRLISRIQGDILAERAYRPRTCAAMSLKPRCAWNGGAVAAQPRTTWVGTIRPRPYAYVYPYAYVLKTAHDFPAHHAPHQEREASMRPREPHATKRRSYVLPERDDQRPGQRGFSGRCYQYGATGHIARECRRTPAQEQTRGSGKGRGHR
ncbi:hypothetical protein HPB50_028753 [Hyalomma asiaticum]|nr:hypothetical protein HPB50_028753 [Hyalomma asiaticum]